MTDYRRSLLAASPQSAMGGGLIHYVFFQITNWGGLTNFQIDGGNSSFTDFTNLVRDINSIDLSTEFIHTMMVQVLVNLDAVNNYFSGQLYTCLVEYDVSSVYLHGRFKPVGGIEVNSFTISFDTLRGDNYFYTFDASNQVYGSYTLTP